jgi:hypothetical protein
LNICIGQACKTSKKKNIPELVQPVGIESFFCYFLDLFGIQKYPVYLPYFGFTINKGIFLQPSAVLLQLAIIYVSALRSFFHTDALSISELLITIGLASLIFWFLEGLKLIGKAMKC